MYNFIDKAVNCFASYVIWHNIAIYTIYLIIASCRSRNFHKSLSTFLIIASSSNLSLSVYYRINLFNVPCFETAMWPYYWLRDSCYLVWTGSRPDSFLDYSSRLLGHFLFCKSLAGTNWRNNDYLCDVSDNEEMEIFTSKVVLRLEQAILHISLVQLVME